MSPEPPINPHPCHPLLCNLPEPRALAHLPLRTNHVCSPASFSLLQGAVINQIKELLGVSIRISKKGEFLPGTYDRACSITGTPEVG